VFSFFSFFLFFFFFFENEIYLIFLTLGLLIVLFCRCLVRVVIVAARADLIALRKARLWPMRLRVLLILLTSTTSWRILALVLTVR
jgi:hypothetical protein